jgi:agmatinase
MAIINWSAIYQCFLLVAARDITFPPSSGFSEQAVFGQRELDITTGSAFAGLTTYANLPYVHCLAGKDEQVEKYDIAILGAPFDTVSYVSNTVTDQIPF